MLSIWQDIRHGTRSLLKTPAFTALIVLILTVGIGANVAMFGVIDGALIRSLPYPEADRLVTVRTIYEGRIRRWISALDYWDIWSLNESFHQLAAYSGFPRTRTVTGVDAPERVPTAIISHELLPALGAQLLMGRGFIAEDELVAASQVTVLSFGYWQRQLGGAQDVIGRVLNLDGVPTEVIGVLGEGFRFTQDVDLWQPMREDDPFIAERGKSNWSLLGRLAPGVSLAQAQTELDVIADGLAVQYPETNQGLGVVLTDLQRAWSERYRDGLFLLQVAVALVLLIACGNAAGLLLARGSTRRSELAVRSALGASSNRIVRQLLIESLLMAGAASVLGVFLSLWLQPLLLRFTATQTLTGLTGISPTVLCFVLLVAVLTGLTFGMLPALRASRAGLTQDLQSAARTTDRRGNRFRSGLVVAQVAVSIVLLFAAGLLIRSLSGLMSSDLGFESDNLITAEIQLPRAKYQEPQQRVQFYRELTERLEAVPGVANVGLITQLPIRQPGNNELVHDLEDPPVGLIESRSAYLRFVRPGYFDAMGIPMMAGRDIEETDIGGSPLVFVVNEAFVDSVLRGRDPIGRQVVLDYEYTFEVVGVVGDVLTGGLADTRFPAMYGSYGQNPSFDMGLALRTSVQSPSVMRALRTTLRAMDPDIPDAEMIEMRTLLSRSQASRRAQTVVLSLFAGVAVLLAVAGLHGVLAQSVVERRREIGVRVAMGAGPGSIIAMVMTRGLVLVALGIGFGLVGALVASRLLDHMLFQVTPGDPLTLIAASILFAAVAVAACLPPVLRALRVDPVSVLQAE